MVQDHKGFCSVRMDRSLMSTDPFWIRVIDAADVVLRHPETELTVEYGDRRAIVWAKVNPETKTLDVAIEVSYTKGVKIDA